MELFPAVYAAEHLRGVVYYNNIFPGIELSQAAGARFNSVFGLEKPSDTIKAFIELGLVLPSTTTFNIVISFNRVTVTREFKPITCSRYGKERFFCKQVYDVTPIIRSKPFEESRVELEYRGMASIEVSHIGMLHIRSHPSASTSLVYFSGALPVEPGEEVNLRLPINIRGPGELRVSSFLPHSQARLLVGFSPDSVYPVAGTGFTEHSLQVDEKRDLQELILAHKGDGKYYPRSIIVSSLLVYSTTAPKPDLAAELVESQGGRAVIRIVNRGTAPAKNVIVVAVSRGSVLARSVIDEIAPGEARDVELSVEPSSTLVRVVWRHLDKTLFRELRIREQAE